MNPSEKLYNKKNSQVIWKTIISDTITPVSIMMRLKDHANTFLLESVEGGTKRGRHSIIGLKPDLWWKSEGHKSFIKQSETGNFVPTKKTPFESLNELLNASLIDLPKTLPRMSAGIFGYIGYDNVRLIENISEELFSENDFPDSLLMRPSLIIVFDNLKDELSIVSTLRYREGVDFKQAKLESENAIDSILNLIKEPLKNTTKNSSQNEIKIESNTTKSEYLKMVQKAKNYIYEGDIFQVVLSQKFSSIFELPAFELYRSLRRINPSPFLFYLNFDDFSVVGSSPEILIRMLDEEVTVRPIAGTRPRGVTDEEDNNYKTSLLNDPKELAEHLMLLDLGRNDVGKVSEFGSVKVTNKFFVELYSHVMHIVSNVVGKLDKKYNIIDVLKAGFPAGTVSGAPKIRAMQIIDELEKEKRGIYAGCVGYFSATGDMDNCITLRTAVIKNGLMHVQAGAGIVADSIPENEYEECRSKAKALFNAAQDALNINNGKI